MARRHNKNLDWFNKEFKTLGYTVELSGQGHYKVWDPSGQRVPTTLSNTPSDHRATKNAIAFLRRWERNRTA